MARVLVESYMARYPLAGMMSWTLQYLVGLDRLGHEVYFVERAPHPWACFDPRTGTNDGGCKYGVGVLAQLLEQVGLGERWAFAESDGTHHGMSATRVAELFRTADIFMVMTFEECWQQLAADIPCRVVLDGDPVFRQIANREVDARGEPRPRYDTCYTAALNAGAADACIPDDGTQWRPLVHPVVTDLFACTPLPVDGPLTSIMNWQSYDTVVHDGTRYGQKDVELERMFELPAHVAAPLELAVAGAAPRGRLRDAGWHVRDGHEVTDSFPAFQRYLDHSLGELSVCKHAYVATRSGWFSDRSGAYLASGRPVVLQDTGFSTHLPCGDGLFAFTTVDDAREAVDRIVAEPDVQGRAARRFAETHLEATRVLGRVMAELGA